MTIKEVNRAYRLAGLKSPLKPLSYLCGPAELFLVHQTALLHGPGRQNFIGAYLLSTAVCGVFMGAVGMVLKQGLSAFGAFGGMVRIENPAVELAIFSSLGLALEGWGIALGSIPLTTILPRWCRWQFDASGLRVRDAPQLILLVGSTLWLAILLIMKLGWIAGPLIFAGGAYLAAFLLLLKAECLPRVGVPWLPLLRISRSAHLPRCSLSPALALLWRRSRFEASSILACCSLTLMTSVWAALSGSGLWYNSYFFLLPVVAASWATPGLHQRCSLYSFGMDLTTLARMRFWFSVLSTPLVVLFGWSLRVVVMRKQLPIETALALIAWSFAILFSTSRAIPIIAGLIFSVSCFTSLFVNWMPLIDASKQFLDGLVPPIQLALAVPFLLAGAAALRAAWRNSADEQALKARNFGG